MSKVDELVEMTLELDAVELQEFLSEIAARLGDPEVSEAWLEEARIRSERLASGASKGIPWEQVREKMFRRVNGSGH